jgi:hypothetical protein
MQRHEMDKKPVRLNTKVEKTKLIVTEQDNKKKNRNFDN